jgi:predicted acylesterase/phospholipase RssA
MFSVGRTAKETAAAEELVRRRINLHASKTRLHDKAFQIDAIPSQTVLILQGGGALGAFECGAVRALEERGVRPDVASAVSIGAFNDAIIASHPGHAAAPLAEFWRELSIALPATPDPCVHESLLSWYVLCMGVPHFSSRAPAGQSGTVASYVRQQVSASCNSDESTHRWTQ